MTASIRGRLFLRLWKLVYIFAGQFVVALRPYFYKTNKEKNAKQGVDHAGGEQ